MNQDQLTSELERIERALRDPQTDERYCQLYAAQQALAWARTPGGFMSPFETIQRGLVQPLRRDIPEGLEDCPAGPRLVRSLGISCPV